MNSMQMPTSPASAGLGAMIQAKGATGAGAPKKTMAQLMALAEKMPDSELADVLAGKSVRVPQFAAMLAAMGRESLRTAVAGAKAGQPEEPSKKDQMLAKMSGIDALPAPNMEPIGAAEGGIVGYAGDPDTGSLVRPSPQYSSEPVDDPDYQRSIEVPPGAFPAWLRSHMEGIRNRDRASAAARGQPLPVLPEVVVTPKDPTMAPQLVAPDMERREFPPQTGAAPTTAAPTTAPRPGVTPPAAPPAAPPASAPRKSFLDGLTDTPDDTEKRLASGKNQAQGEFLLQLGASIMGTPNLGQALMQGIQRGLPGLAANRREANSLIKDQREYRLNMAKAQEAAAQGKDDLVFKYAKLAEDSKYHAGMVAAATMRASGSGANLTAKQYDAARKAADTALDNELKRLGPRARLMTPDQRDAFRAEAFNRTLQAIQSGVMPPAPGIPTVEAPPQNVVVRE